MASRGVQFSEGLARNKSLAAIKPPQLLFFHGAFGGAEMVFMKRSYLPRLGCCFQAQGERVSSDCLPRCMAKVGGYFTLM